MPAAMRAQLAAGRRPWLDQVDALTQLHRYRVADELEKRGRELAAERRRKWQRGEVLSEADRDALIESLLWQAQNEPEEDVRTWLIDAAGAVNEGSTLPSFSVARSYTGRPRNLPPLTTQWHDARAEGKRELFTRVEACADEAQAIKLVCRGVVQTATGEQPCAHSECIPIGCGAQHFCSACRIRLAQRFRVDFERKRLGLIGEARKAQLMGRWRRRDAGGRFGERMVTLTLPHWGTPIERVRVLRETWPRFWRLLSDEMRPRLAALAAGIRTVNPERFDPLTGEVHEYRKKGGRKVKAARARGKIGDDELSLWDVVSYLWVFEWTTGDDSLGHPHLHVWLFSPFIPRAMIQRLWARAFADVGEHLLVEPEPGEQVFKVARGVPRLDVDGFEERDEFGEVVRDYGEPTPLIVHVRAAWEIERDGKSVGSELIKYLTKDWEVSADGVKRAPPEVFAQVYTAIDGRRARQSSSGLQRWAIGKHVACPCCGYMNARGHWAFAYFHVVPIPGLERVAAANEGERVFPTYATGPPGSESHEQQLNREYWERRDLEWSDSLELRVLQGRWRKMFPDLAKRPASAPPPASSVQGSFF